MMRGSRESFDSVRWRRDFRSRWHRRPTPQRSTSHPSSDSSSDRSWWKPTGWQSDFRRSPRLSIDKSCTRPGPIRRPDPIETSTTLWRQEPAQPEAHSRPLPRRYTHQAPPRLPHLSPSRTMHVPLADSLIHSTASKPNLPSRQTRRKDSAEDVHTQPARVPPGIAHFYQLVL